MKIKDFSGSAELGKFVTNADMEIECNQIILIDGGLYSIDKVKHIEGACYEIGVYWQDAVLAKDGVLFESLIDES